MTTNVYLKLINPAGVHKKYLDSFFDRPVPQKEGIKIAQNDNKLTTVYSNNQLQGVFSIKDRYNNPIVIATTEFTNLIIHGTGGSVNGAVGRCDCCKRDFPIVKDGGNKNEGPGGYPYSYDRQTLLENNKYVVKHIFFIKGQLCSYQCCLYWMNLLKLNPDLLHSMYKIHHPNAPPLRESNDPRLLISNGGSLTEDEWLDEKYQFRETNKNIKFIPMRTEFQRQETINQPNTNKKSIFKV